MRNEEPVTLEQIWAGLEQLAAVIGMICGHLGIDATDARVDQILEEASK
jgi:hypothetical protein